MGSCAAVLAPPHVFVLELRRPTHCTPVQGGRPNIVTKVGTPTYNPAFANMFLLALSYYKLFLCAARMRAEKYLCAQYQKLT